ncbi:hypothetical protein TEA_008508 [Camellia sinensis var. sinensis]|uniref:Uncharacterized protein n=1 Tax=Camellia sinensis var. sinensis TaxID=542762 RepID=A0A4S4EXG6_CAMSN|nr:hypothetical protein TEA_008508 [Camellia sinensis var. sinensis]
MRKRERENPCGVCGHYHKYEEGEVCGICGHRMPAVSEKTSLQVSAFPSEILPEFLYLGSYDNASRSELLKTQGISRVLNDGFICGESLEKGVDSTLSPKCNLVGSSSGSGLGVILCLNWASMMALSLRVFLQTAKKWKRRKEENLVTGHCWLRSSITIRALTIDHDRLRLGLRSGNWSLMRSIDGTTSSDVGHIPTHPLGSQHTVAGQIAHQS